MTTLATKKINCHACSIVAAAVLSLAPFNCLVPDVSGALAASPQLGPALKAIDPSQARYDTSSQPSPAPISQPANSYAGDQGQSNATPPGGYQPGFQGATPGYGGQGQGQYQQNPYPQNQYQQPQYGGSPQYGTPQYQQQPGNGYQGQQAPGYGQSNYGSPPQQNYGAPGYGAPGGSNGFPAENQISDFNKPLPNSAPTGGAPSNSGGWVTQQPAAQSQSSGSDDERIGQLEQNAFGSMYPEHETADRLDHLEKEVFGAPSTGEPLQDRLARLEGKLSGAGAFNATASGGAKAGGGASGGSSTSHKPPKKEKEKTEAPVKIAKGPALNRDTDKRSDSSAPSTSSGANTIDVQNVINKIPFKKSAGDFMPAIRRFNGDVVARWTSFPVRIHLPDGSPDSWQHILENGVKSWGQFIPFETARTGEPADIDVMWVNRIAAAKVLGITRLQTPEGAMQMQIFLLRPTFYQSQIPEQALNVVFLHELGHALGLLGHSDKPGDVMSPIDVAGKGKIKTPSIEARDLNTLRHVYGTNPIPGGFNLPQPIEWSFTTDR